MVMHSPPLEDGYSITLEFGFCECSYSSPCYALAFALTLRVHIDEAFILFQNHSPYYV
jgi:hypothetical protein